MAGSTTDVAFSPAVQAIQERKGSRATYARLEQRGGWSKEIDAELAAFLAERDSAYLATASAGGQPYIQHRGGPPGFLRVLDPHTLGFADFRGNRQYITLGNLSENPRAFLFVMDYARQRRIKLWGRARVVEGDTALLEHLADPTYAGRAEQAILFSVEAWDENCRQHIPQQVGVAAVQRALAPLQQRIAALEAENRELRHALEHATRTRDHRDR